MTSTAVREASFDEYLARIESFTDTVLIPRESEMVRLGEVPFDIVETIKDLGLFGITLPREWSGLGWSMEQQVLLTMEFTRASSIYRSRFSTTIGLCSQIILEHGTLEQQRQYLPAMAEGRCVAAFALTEPGAGSDAGSVATTASRKAGAWILNGRKRFITNGAWADVLVVFARTDDGAGLSAFIVDRRADGVGTQAAALMNGHEAAPVSEIWFENAVVDNAALIGGVTGRGLQQALRGINHARTHVAATAVGQAVRLLDEAVRHAVSRRQFGKSLIEIGAVEGMLGLSFAEIEAGKAIVLQCAREFDSSSVVWPNIAAAKLFCTEMVGRVADRAVQILGGEGIVGDSAVPRMWRDVRWLRIGEGASELHQANLGRYVANIAKDA